MTKATNERLVPTIHDAPWPAELDALTAAPEHHTLVLENDHVRVLETRIPPGQRTKVHTHCWPTAQYVKRASHVVRYDGSGTVIYDSRKAGTTLENEVVRWGDPLAPHALENVGDQELCVISVEIKTAG